MGTLISKDEEIKSSVVYLGYLILKALKKEKDDKISIFEVVNALKKNGIVHGRQFMFAMIFLHSLGLIDFKAPYIYRL